MNELPKLDTKTTKESIIKFIQDKVSEANAKGLVVGLSGGIDSTLTAYLATEAVGKENVFGIVMPSTTTPTEDKIHGTDIAKILDIDYKEMAIDSVLNEFLYVTQYKTENEQLKERIEYLERSNNRREDTILEQREEIGNLEQQCKKQKEVIDKVIECVEKEYYSKNTVDIESMGITTNKLLQVRNLLKEVSE